MSKWRHWHECHSCGKQLHHKLATIIAIDLHSKKAKITKTDNNQQLKSCTVIRYLFRWFLRNSKIEHRHIFCYYYNFSYAQFCCAGGGRPTSTVHQQYEFLRWTIAAPMTFRRVIFVLNHLLHSMHFNCDYNWFLWAKQSMQSPCIEEGKRENSHNNMNMNKSLFIFLFEPKSWFEITNSDSAEYIHSRMVDGVAWHTVSPRSDIFISLMREWLYKAWVMRILTSYAVCQHGGLQRRSIGISKSSSFHKWLLRWAPIHCTVCTAAHVWMHLNTLNRIMKRHMT